MADVVVLGAGVAGHTAALHLRRLLPKNNTVTVVTPNSQWNWIPSNIWVGVGQMGKSDVVFPLAPVYAKQGIGYVQAKAVGLHRRGGGEEGDRVRIGRVGGKGEGACRLRDCGIPGDLGGHQIERGLRALDVGVGTGVANL